jgi:hypothetical protein
MNRWYLHFFAIAVLPLLGFWLERGLSEPFAGPALYALYAVGLVTFALILTGRLVPSALSVPLGCWELAQCLPARWPSSAQR